MTTVAGIIKDGAAQLAEAGIGDARRDAAALVSIALKRDRTFLFAHPDYQLNEEELVKVEECFALRAKRVPLQYIRGTQEFFGLEFEVTPEVLIPRPETEMLVETAIEVLGTADSPTFLDMGTGSGCIAVAILANVPSATAVAVDISPAAIAVAERNAARHGVSERLTIVESDLFLNVTSFGFKLIVSNPPYVPRDEMPGLQPEVRDHEPRTALTDSSDGLSIIKKIVRQAPKFLSPHGVLLVEMGFGQAEKVLSDLDAGAWESARVDPDLQGIPRMLFARSR